MGKNRLPTGLPAPFTDDDPVLQKYITEAENIGCLVCPTFPETRGLRRGCQVRGLTN